MVLGQTIVRNQLAVSSKFRVISFECHCINTDFITILANPSWFPVKNLLISTYFCILHCNTLRTPFFQLASLMVYTYSTLIFCRFFSLITNAKCRNACDIKCCFLNPKLNFLLIFSACKTYLMDSQVLKRVLSLYYFEIRSWRRFSLHPARKSLKTAKA